MADNFDSNVARRKPNVIAKKRPIHPWDVDAENVDDKPQARPLSAGVSENDETTLPVPAGASSRPRKKSSPSASVTADISSGRLSAPSKKASDLSNTINIHSNYCKLDNDVSDILFARLSASAQSVYLRLYRQSFGWNRNWAAESLPKLSKACNLSLQTIRKAIRELESIGVIRKNFSDYHRATVYRVFLPSEINIAVDTASNNTRQLSGGLLSDTQKEHVRASSSQIIDDVGSGARNSDAGRNGRDGLRNLDVNEMDSGGQNIAIQSIYFSGTSIYNLLESEGALPKNISKHITDIHLSEAVSIIDSFYDSIGFSIVSRSLYRKSLIDYIELLKAGFSDDDIRYAVRWIFKNSRTRPESFSLIKHTIHLSMEDLIRELKDVSGKKELAKEKRRIVDESVVAESAGDTKAWEAGETEVSVSSEDLKQWLSITDDLKKSLNEHSFGAFIEPLRLKSVVGDEVHLGAPPDSVSWVADHYLDRIKEVYCEKTGREITVTIH